MANKFFTIDEMDNRIDEMEAAAAYFVEVIQGMEWGFELVKLADSARYAIRTSDPMVDGDWFIVTRDEIDNFVEAVRDQWLAWEDPGQDDIE